MPSGQPSKPRFNVVMRRKAAIILIVIISFLGLSYFIPVKTKEFNGCPGGQLRYSILQGDFKEFDNYNGSSGLTFCGGYTHKARLHIL